MTKKKTSVIKFFCTKQDIEESKKRMSDLEKKDTIVVDDIPDEKTEDHPKAIIGKIIDQNTKIETNNSIISKMFTYEDADVFVICDKNGEYWYKGKDIASLLEYKNTKAAIINNVTDKYKKSYADIGVSRNDPIKIDPQTIFIDDCGLFQLVSRSKKKEAVVLWRKITKEILPTLFKTGTYTLPITQTDIDRLNKSFYTDNFLSDFDNKPVIYFAYIGKHKVKINGVTREEHILKFGVTRKMSRRDLEEHRKFYETFNVLGIWETLSNFEVEEQLKKNFESNGMLVDVQIKGKNKKKEENRREHIVINEIKNLDYCLNMIENVVKNTVNPLEQQLQQKIKELEQENKMIIQENNMLKQKNTLAESMIRTLKKTVKYLQK